MADIFEPYFVRIGSPSEPNAPHDRSSFLMTWKDEMAHNYRMTGCEPLSNWFYAYEEGWPGTVDTTPRPVNGLATGSKELDSITTGLRAGSLTIIGGRPSMGSTSFALSIALNIALDQGKNAVIFSLDYDAEKTVGRILRVANELDRPRNHRAAEAKNELPDVALERFRNAPIFIDGTASDLADIRESIEMLIDRGVLPDLVVIDTLEMLAGIHSVKRRKTVVRKIKTLAQDIGVPVMVTTKLPRRLEKRVNKRPWLFDIPEGVITGGADLVMTIFRHEVYSPGTRHKDIAEISVVRNRFGPVGTLELCFRSGNWLPFSAPPREACRRVACSSLSK